MRKELWDWKYQKLGEKVVSNLKRKKHDAYLVERKEGVIPLLKEIMKENSTVAVGGSLTLTECGVLDFLREGNFNFLDRYNVKSKEELEEIYYNMFRADYFLCSANAITEDGKIVQLDGNGTRVAPMIFGPKHVIIVAGMNKVVPDIESANKRIEYISPMNSKRLNFDTPCTYTGKCDDCMSPERICIHRVIVESGVRHPGRFKIILVKEDLGL
ncbi:lactate utilization protein [Marinitoga lauensis]|uniref:lactate utilization protein n=1 Tax=Marinitoga lauensis TaxID=2201189 RepID=UPI0010100D23|nr:lactate utilization protein [Marinitoga lauensis]